MARIFPLLFALLAIQSIANGLSVPLNDNNEQQSQKAPINEASLEETLLKRLERLEEEVGELRKEKAADQIKLENLEKRIKELESPKFQFNEKRNEKVFQSNQGQIRSEIGFFNDENTKSINIKDVKKTGRAVIPQSCRELATAGQTIDSIYFIQSPINLKKIAAVYCDFNSGSPAQTDIGYLDVKTSPVHFYVQRTSSYSTTNSVIPWQLARLNLGNAMSLTTGIFTAPKDGIYQFDFSGDGDPNFAVYLQLNGVNIGFSTATRNDDMGSINARLALKQGDTVNLRLAGGILFDDSANHWNHFVGWLDEEDLVF